VGAGGYAAAPVRFSRGLKQLVVRHSWHPSGTGADPWDPSVRDVVQEITLRDGPFKNFLDLSRALGPACTVVLPSPHMESAGDCLTHTPIDGYTWQVSGPWVCPSTAPSTPDALTAVEGHLNRSWLAHGIITRLHRAAAKAGLAKGRASFTSNRSGVRGGEGGSEHRASRRGSAPSPALLAMAVAGTGGGPGHTSASVARRGATNSTATESALSPTISAHRRSHSSPDLLHQAMLGTTETLKPPQTPFTRSSLENLTLPGPALPAAEAHHSSSAGGTSSSQRAGTPSGAQTTAPLSPSGTAAARVATLASDEGGQGGGSFRSKKRLRRPSARHSIISIFSDASGVASSLVPALGQGTTSQRMPHERLLGDWAVWASVSDVPSAVGPEGHVLPPLTGSCSTQLLRRNSLTPGVYTPKWEHLAPPRLRSRTTSARNTWGMFRALSGGGGSNSKNSRVFEAWLDEVTSMELAMHESGVQFAQSIVLPIAPVDTLRIKVPSELMDTISAELSDVRSSGSSGALVPARVLQLFVITAPAIESWTLMDVQPVVDASPVLELVSPPLSPTSDAIGPRRMRPARRGSGPPAPSGWAPSSISVISEEDTSKGLTHSAASSESGSRGASPKNRGGPSGSYATDTTADQSPSSSGIKRAVGGPSSKERNHSAPSLPPVLAPNLRAGAVSAGNAACHERVRGAPLSPAVPSRSSVPSSGSDDDTTDDEGLHGGSGGGLSLAGKTRLHKGAIRKTPSPTHAGLKFPSGSNVKMRGDLRHLADLQRNEVDLIGLAASRPGADEVSLESASQVGSKATNSGVRFSPPTHKSPPGLGGGAAGQYSICELKFAASVPAVLVRFLWRVHEPSSPQQ